MAGPSIKVEGLRATALNLLTMSARMQGNISRSSLRAAARVLTKAIKAKSGSTYDEDTGLVRRGFTAGVAPTSKNGTLQFASVFQRKQPITEKTKRGRIAVQKFRRIRKSNATAMRVTAFWWRFLEFGTKARPGRGSVRARPWIGPAAEGAAGAAVEAFRDTMKRRVDEEAASLPSTRGKP